MLGLRSKEVKKRKVIVTYIPPKTNAWETNRYKTMQLETINNIKEIIGKGNKVFLIDNFKTKGINWEEMEVKENVRLWSKELMHTVTVNTV